MKHKYTFYIILADGHMLKEEMRECTVREKHTLFCALKEKVAREFPGGTAGWLLEGLIKT